MINVIDLETCSLEAGVVEVAVVRTPQPESGFLSGWSLVQPDCPISFEAMATHHITEDMVKDQPTFKTVLANLALRPGEQYAAHNAAFDSKFFPIEYLAQPWICTYRVALHLWPEAPSHSNQVLRYYLNLDVSDMPEEAGLTPHRALYDAWVTAKMLERQIDEVKKLLRSEKGPLLDGEPVLLDEAVGRLLKLSSEPVVLRKVRFGKNRGMLWKDVDKGYLQWVCKQTDMDADTLHTARHYLNA